MEHSQLDFTAAGVASEFFHTCPNFTSGKNILYTIFSYAAVGALIPLLIISLHCIVIILWQSIQKLATELYLAVLRNKKRGDARSQHGRYHPRQRSWGRDLMGKGKSGLEGPPGPARASTPKPESVCFTISCLSPTPLTLTGGNPQPPFSKENLLRALVNKSPGHNRVFQSKLPWWLSCLPDRLVQTPAATHVIVYGFPAVRGIGSLKHSKNIEPFRELRN